MRMSIPLMLCSPLCTRSSLRWVAVLAWCVSAGGITGCRAGAGGAPTLANAAPMGPARLLLPVSFADSVVSRRIAPIATLHRVVNLRAPWRAWILEIEARPCFRVQAVKGGTTALGRATTSTLLKTLPDASRAVAAVNADFFSFTPPGVPTDLHVELGRLIAGPGTRPVVWSDEKGRVHIDTLVARGRLTTARDTVPLTAWNRPGARMAGILDAAWGVPLDSTMRSAQLYQLVPAASSSASSRSGQRPQYLVRAIPAADRLAASWLARGDTLLLHVPAASRIITRLQDGDTATVEIGLALRAAQDNRSLAVRDAVGGRPMLLSDSLIAADVETEGATGFRDLNPRTAMGIDRIGRRLWLAVIDGRQPGYSVGMTLRQTAELLQRAGAVRAINLDGGGSSAMAVRGPADDEVTLVNHPSGGGVERAVANALSVHATCALR